MLCRGISEVQNEYASDMKTKLMKIARNEEEEDMINMILEDIKKCVCQESEEYATTQHLVGMDLAFKGWVVKNWLDVQQRQSLTMKKLNKVIVKCSVVCYSKAWTHRNEIMHDDIKQREFVIDLYGKIVDEIEKGNKPNMKRHVRSQKLDVEKCDAGYIKL